MTAWQRAKKRKHRTGLVLASFGVAIWIAAVAVHHAAAPAGDIGGEPAPHRMLRSLGIIAGGAAVTGGIALIALAA
jgi:hypothetical protein